MILIGEKNKNIKYDFRETVFGICLRNEELYLTKKGEDISLIGGGIESNETEETTLKREALEEAGLEIIGMNKICDIDCYWRTIRGRIKISKNVNKWSKESIKITISKTRTNWIFK